MISSNKKQSGFTIVELIIVIVVIGILALITITAFSGVTQRARNTERQADIKAIYSSLEYYATNNGGYPSQADLVNAAWRTGNNMKGLDVEALRDPSQASGGVPAAGTAAPTAVGAYVYSATPTSCVSPTVAAGTANTGTFCTGYTIWAFQENGAGVFSKTSLN